ncbi:MAG TPA: ATP synthase subunit I [Candidatus Saccharimonadales bacterium]|nr:ATP synthase subunit I [Candidatus Saccharimonadales bacterium]
MTGQPDAGLLGAATERRISWLTLAVGLAAGVLVGVLRDRVWGLGVAIGGLLAWLNFRWLRRGLDVFLTASTAQGGRTKPAVPLTTYFAAAFRYGLLGLAIYVIFIYLKVPVLSMLVGLFALGAATIAASLYEILRPAD